MGTSTCTMWMDEDFKRKFGTVYEELGCDISIVVTMLWEKLIRKRYFSFEVSAGSFYSPANRAQQDRGIALLEAGKNPRSFK